WPAPSGSDPFKGLNASTTTSIGADLYLGLEFFIWIPFIGKVTFANFGVRGGVQTSSGATWGTLVDVNGDGMPDLTWKNGSSLGAYLNTGAGFDLSRPFTLPGLSGLLDAERGDGFSFGMSAGILGTSGAVTWQESWQKGLSGFADVNGDGLVDYISAGDDRFRLNTGSELRAVGWSGVPSAVEGGVGSLGEDTYASTYYLQEPFRAWKAYRSGTVVVDQQAALLHPTAASGVRLHADPPAGQPVPAPLALSSAVSSREARDLQLDLKAGDRVYFYEEASPPSTATEEASQRTRWNVKVRYSRIKLFESLQAGAIFLPPQTLASLPDAALIPIYQGNYNLTTWTLRGDWEGMDAATVNAAREALIKLGYFVPRRIPGQQFLRVLSAAASGGRIATRALQNDATETTPDAALAEGFIYEPETATFVRVQSARVPTADSTELTTDQLFMKYVPALTEDERMALARTKRIDDVDYVWVRGFEDGSVGYEESAAPRTVPAVITEDGSQGNVLPGKGLCLETTYDDRDGLPLERLWLQRDAGGQWNTVARESLQPEAAGQVTRETGVATTTATGTTFDVVLNDHGVRRHFVVSGKAPAQQIPGSMYEGPVSAEILSSEDFSTQGAGTIPAASWTAVTHNSDPANPVFKALTPCYFMGLDSDYHLADPASYTPAQLADALSALNQASAPVALAGSGQSLFRTLPADPARALRLLLLTQAQLDVLGSCAPAGQAGAVTACFQPIQSGSDTMWYQAAGLGPADLGLVRSAMERCRRDLELFPYYGFDSAANAWLLKPGVDTDPSIRDRILAVLDQCGIQSWTTVQRGIRYTSGQALPVIAHVALPPGEKEDSIVPTGDRAAGPGEMVGVVEVPSFDPVTGDTRITRRYFHDFDSLADFSSQDLVVFPTAPGGNRLFNGDATMAGGVFGWYYGLWSGYYCWDKSLLGKNSTDKDKPSRPPYSAVMGPNRDENGAPRITTSGREEIVTVPGSAWVGTVTSYSDVSMNADLSTTTSAYSFAAFVDGDQVSMSRSGGDAYYRIPHGGSGSGTGSGAGSGAGGPLPFVRNSHSSAVDLNGSAGIAGFGGANISRNESDSWQFQGIMDMNGDRYPDLVSFPDSRDGSASFTVTPGTGQGFGGSSTFTLPGSVHLGRFRTVSYGFGGSLSSSSGGIKDDKDSKGRSRNIELLNPAPTSSGFGGSVAVNGVFGATVQSDGFFDMNGDGLPDQVSRGAGDFSVSLNRGDGTFATAVGWGAGTTEKAFPSFLPGDLKNQTEGISHTGTGSFGATGSLNMGVDAGGGGFTVGVTAGFNSTANQTHSSLADVNGDGLADQVVKLKAEPFFRVRFNLGDHLGEEVHLYRPEWNTGSSVYRDSIQHDLGILAQGLGGVS
ncbi:MAG TPA: VCBS repeat-containing protein, partial [Spirochaetia bacterium]|nr:VCBS repeat-containing protein [Spirochaetia bacterium]